jgi:hypothetical protein
MFDGLHAALKSLAGGGEVARAVIEPPTPAVSIRKSVTPDYLICLDDGKQFKSLRRHLTAFGLTDLRQLDLLRYCLVTTIRGRKTPWHYFDKVTFESNIFNMLPDFQRCHLRRSTEPI